MTLRRAAGASLLLASGASAALAQSAVLAPAPGPLATALIPSKVLANPSAALVSSSPRAVQVAVPLERRLSTPPVEAFRIKPAIISLEALPSATAGATGQQNGVFTGWVQPAPIQRTPAGTGSAASGAIATQFDGNGAIGVQNFGLNRRNTIYHYSDSLVDPLLLKHYPHRPTGWFVFVTSNGAISRCSASLISRSVLVTAGHCVHDGGNKAAGFIRSGTFYAGYVNGSHLGIATANAVYTTTGWYNEGFLDQGYDIGLVVLNKRIDLPASAPPQEIGASVGWYGFCSSSCLQTYWHLSQLGYPANYYSGNYQTRGEHIAASDTRDYVFGSGMQGGSSGGPHVANLGSISDSSVNRGQWPYRNTVFAVTSWGYVDETQKIQGASSLSGPSNTNNFKGMWNSACTRARALHGSATCTLLP